MSPECSGGHRRMQPTLTLPGSTFRATVELAGRTATGVRVPAAVVDALEAGRQPLVKVTIGEHTYRSKVAVRGGEYRLPISAENRALAGVEAGDEIEVGVQLDRDPRVVAVPSDLAAALEAAPDALHYFESLSYSRQRWFVLYVEEARTPETRARRIERAIARLREG
jgi:Bacteriocin-protection, YdeI or OmpD-Associated/Domain of unknown function (DUF1905)